MLQYSISILIYMAVLSPALLRFSLKKLQIFVVVVMATAFAILYLHFRGVLMNLVIFFYGEMSLENIRMLDYSIKQYLGAFNIVSFSSCWVSSFLTLTLHRPRDKAWSWIGLLTSSLALVILIVFKFFVKVNIRLF